MTKGHRAAGADRCLDTFIMGREEGKRGAEKSERTHTEGTEGTEVFRTQRAS